MQEEGRRGGEEEQDASQLLSEATASTLPSLHLLFEALLQWRKETSENERKGRIGRAIAAIELT